MSDAQYFAATTIRYGAIEQGRLVEHVYMAGDEINPSVVLPADMAIFVANGTVKTHAAPEAEAEKPKEAKEPKPKAEPKPAKGA